MYSGVWGLLRRIAVGIWSSGMWFVLSVSGEVCEGEARPNQRALAGVYQQMPQSCVAMGKEQRAARTCDGSNVRNTVLDLRDLPNRPDSSNAGFFN